MFYLLYVRMVDSWLSGEKLMESLWQPTIALVVTFVAVTGLILFLTREIDA